MGNSGFANNVLEGKKITILGDSITAGVGASDPEHRYSTVLCRLLGAKEENLGISGCVICEGGHRYSRVEDSKTVPADSDIVLVLLGINDFDQCRKREEASYYDLGTPETKDTSTIYGAMDATLSGIRSSVGTGTKVYVCTPVMTSWNNSMNTTSDWNPDKKTIWGYTLRDLCEAEIACARRYGMPVIDLNADCPLREEHLPDGLHPNDEGHRLMAETIAQRLLQDYGDADSSIRC